MDPRRVNFRDPQRGQGGPMRNRRQGGNERWRGGYGREAEERNRRTHERRQRRRYAQERQRAQERQNRLVPIQALGGQRQGRPVYARVQGPGGRMEVFTQQYVRDHNLLPIAEANRIRNRQNKLRKRAKRQREQQARRQQEQNAQRNHPVEPQRIVHQPAQAAPQQNEPRWLNFYDTLGAENFHDEYQRWMKEKAERQAFLDYPYSEEGSSHSNAAHPKVVYEDEVHSEASDQSDIGSASESDSETSEDDFNGHQEPARPPSVFAQYGYQPQPAAPLPAAPLPAAPQPAAPRPAAPQQPAPRLSAPQPAAPQPSAPRQQLQAQGLRNRPEAPPRPLVNAPRLLRRVLQPQIAQMPNPVPPRIRHYPIELPPEGHYSLELPPGGPYPIELPPRRNQNLHERPPGLVRGHQDINERPPRFAQQVERRQEAIPRPPIRPQHQYVNPMFELNQNLRYYERNPNE